MDLFEIGAKLGIYFIPFLFSLCVHEYAHGWVAQKKGDETAKMMGRLTLNPTAHADMIGTYVLPVSAILLGTPFFGWAKPVPVDPRNLKNPKVDMFWVAAAGPLSNVLLAIISAFALAGFAVYGAQLSFVKPMVELFRISIIINLFLAFFNLLPIHPLDGGKILARFLPDHLNDKLEENQHITSMLLLVLFLTGLLSFLVGPVYFLGDSLIKLAYGIVS